MDKNNLYFHIHYCTHRETYEDWKQKHKKKIARKINHHELFLVTGGKGYISTENREFFVEKGMLFYLKPDVFHSIEPNLSEPLTFLSVHFSFICVNFCNDKWNLSTEIEYLKFPTMQKFKNHYPLFHIFKKLVETWSTKLPDYEFSCRMILEELLLEIHDNLKRQDTNYSSTLKVEKIIKYLHENINKSITLKELSDLVSFSPSYLSRTFKDTTGYSIIEFFNKMKIDKAEALIMVGDKKIKEISELLGFKDEFYFSRLFKKIKGISPKEFYNKNVHEY
ncbi:AraC family transcriptional regulator [Clostridium carboxidivorans P7]|uniref:Transcriptional regulator, AraC family n=1 Tax=Clostridium carboxidivorans P7 TaxID=536227 RepID=C6PWF1_9CLOT|nr:AraC family transcriptional regulator [Clostridium carboxidivorans]AKN30520.1 AraC family transcriptional regulator [Clostridium carboxidivorans P7]EET86428.1 transcriptional regulator, AraC family [Clostridium carboxidivorans P7]EFG86263.1 transcriptional regulator, AraC family [Clostridium carboxidivorans P7]